MAKASDERDPPPLSSLLEASEEWVEAREDVATAATASLRLAKSGKGHAHTRTPSAMGVASHGERLEVLQRGGAKQRPIGASEETLKASEAERRGRA